MKLNFHGGDVYSCKEDVLDFSSNINPLGVPESFKKALLEQIQEFTKYPDIHYRALRSALGEYLEVTDTDCIVPGNGAVELLYKAIQQSGKSKLVCLQPTFSEYSRAAAQKGLELVQVAAFEKDFQEINMDKLLAAADKNSVFVLCNPNNPTGTLLRKAQLKQLAEELQKRDALLIMDEAFMEFTPEPKANSMLDQLQNYSNLLIVKAATKFFGMPGIRLGYAISSHKELIHAIGNSLEPWNVNTAAVIAGCTVLKDKEYIQSSRAWILQERPFLYNELSKIPQIKVYSSGANFHLVKLLAEITDGGELKRRLLEKGLLIRTIDGFAGLDQSYIRLAVKDRASNLHLVKSLQEIYKISL